MLKNEFERKITAAVTESAKLNEHKMNLCGQLTKVTEKSYIIKMKTICCTVLDWLSFSEFSSPPPPRAKRGSYEVSLIYEKKQTIRCTILDS